MDGLRSKTVGFPLTGPELNRLAEHFAAIGATHRKVKMSLKLARIIRRKGECPVDAAIRAASYGEGKR